MAEKQQRLAREWEKKIEHDRKYVNTLAVCLLCFSLHCRQHRCIPLTMEHFASLTHTYYTSRRVGFYRCDINHLVDTNTRLSSVRRETNRERERTSSRLDPRELEEIISKGRAPSPVIEMPQEYPLQRRTSFISTGTNSYPSSQPPPPQMDNAPNPNFQRFYGPVKKGERDEERLW